MIVSKAGVHVNKLTCSIILGATGKERLPKEYGAFLARLPRYHVICSCCFGVLCQQRNRARQSIRNHSYIYAHKAPSS